MNKLTQNIQKVTFHSKRSKVKEETLWCLYFCSFSLFHFVQKILFEYYLFFVYNERKKEEGKESEKERERPEKIYNKNVSIWWSKVLKR